MKTDLTSRYNELKELHRVREEKQIIDQKILEL